MPITPNSSVFTALSLTDIAKPLPRAAAQGVQRPASDTGNVDNGQGRQRKAEDGARFRQAVSQTKAEGQDEGDASRQQQVAEDFRREAVNPRRPTFQKLGQIVDLSV